MKYYSKKTNAVYDDKITKIPACAIEITEALFFEIIEKRNNGFELSSDSNGNPVLNKSIQYCDPREAMVISNAQARLKLIKLGLFDAIDKAILSMPRNEPIYVLWEYGTNFYRTDEHLTAFCTDTLKMKAEDIDALFLES